MAVHQEPSSVAAVQQFLEAQDLALLEKPLVFERTEQWNTYQCCLGLSGCVCTLGVSALLCPVGTFCPAVLFKSHNLKLDKDAVQLNSASNDCCCHIASSVKTVPLEKIQDVELSKDWVQSIFGLQMVTVQTAGQAGPGAEIQASFLESPDLAREAIRLAVKLRHDTDITAPAQQAGMQRGGRPGHLAQRLQRLNQLVAKNVLSEGEMLGVRAGVLAAEIDITQLLLEAADLAEQGLITGQELATMKAKWLAQL